jgi:hypothetical protein
VLVQERSVMNSMCSEEESSTMEAQWIAERAALRCLSRQHPQWTQQELATCLGRSVSW